MPIEEPIRLFRFSITWYAPRTDAAKALSATAASYPIPEMRWTRQPDPAGKREQRGGNLPLSKTPSALSLLGLSRGYSLPQFSDPNDSASMSSGSLDDNLLELGDRLVNKQRAVEAPRRGAPIPRQQSRSSSGHSASRRKGFSVGTGVLDAAEVYQNPSELPSPLILPSTRSGCSTIFFDLVFQASRSLLLARGRAELRSRRGSRASRIGRGLRA